MSDVSNKVAGQNVLGKWIVKERFTMAQVFLDFYPMKEMLEEANEILACDRPVGDCWDKRKEYPECDICDGCEWREKWESELSK